MDLLDYSTLLWDNGKPYYLSASGKKSYVPPASAMSMWDDPKALAWAKSQGYYIDGGREGLTKPMEVGADGKVIIPPNPVHMASQSGGIFHTTGTWDSNSGEFEHSIDWGNIMTIAIAGAIAAPFVAAAVGGAVGGGAGGAAGGAGGAGTLASSAIAPTLGTLPGVAASGAVPAAFATAAPLASTAIAPTLGALAGGAPSGAVPAALAGGEAAAAGGEVAAATLPSSATLVPTTGAMTAGVPASGAVPAAFAPSAAATSGSLTSTLLSKAPAAAQSIVGNYLQKRGTDDAVDAQVAGQDKALAAEIAANERAIGILSPWANVGGAAVTNLGQLMHLTPPNAMPGTIPTSAAQQTSAQTFGANAIRNGAPSASQTVLMVGPDGSQRQVPVDHIQDLLKKGAKLAPPPPLASAAPPPQAIPQPAPQG